MFLRCVSRIWTCAYLDSAGLFWPQANFNQSPGSLKKDYLLQKLSKVTFKQPFCFIYQNII